MFNDEFNQLNPIASEVESIIELNQIAHEFRREVEHREAFRQHCHWYHTTAQQHQLELVKMRNELNLFELFCRFIQF